MGSTHRNARIAGLVYLLLVLTAPIRLLYVPGKLFVAGDAAATAANLVAHEGLFRLGLVTDLAAGTIVLFVVLALARLFADVDRTLCVLMVVFGGLIVAPIYFLNLGNDIAALTLAKGDAYLAVFSKPQLDALALFFLRMHRQVVIVNEMFWGIWLFPLAALILRSRFLPRLLGWWLIANGLAYCVTSLVGLAAPQYAGTVDTVAAPALFGELATMLWLVIFGARRTPRAEPAA